MSLTYDEAKQLVDKSRKDTPKLERNTYLLYDEGNDEYCVQYHSTMVVSISKNNVYTLRTGGWNTKSTAERMTTYSPVTVSGSDYGLHVYLGNWRIRAALFSGLQVDYHGNVLNKQFELEINAGSQYGVKMMKCQLAYKDKNVQVEGNFRANKLTVAMHSGAIGFEVKHETKGGKKNHTRFEINKEDAALLLKALETVLEPMIQTHDTDHITKHNRGLEVEL